MGKPSPRKQKKQKERQRKDRRKVLADARMLREQVKVQRRASMYPAFRFDTTEGNPDFVRLVRSALGRISFDDDSIFSQWEQSTYRAIAETGAANGMAALREAMSQLEQDGDPRARFGEIQFILGLGQAVFDRIPEDELLSFLPFNDVRFLPVDRHIEVTFRSLLESKGSFGTCFYSRRRPIIDVEGEKKVVAFSRHAIERICQRINPRWKTYAALGDVYAYFDQCIRFEQCDLYGGQLGFTFYDVCDDDRFFQHGYVTEVLGAENIDPSKGRCCYRVGYCPAVIEGEFIKAKTLLFPGFVSTPEYEMLLRSPMPRKTRDEMIAKTRNMDAAYILEQDDFSVIKWFHDNGVPQVVQMQQLVFAPLK